MCVWHRVQLQGLTPKQQAAAENLMRHDVISGYLASASAEQREFEEALNGREKALFAQAVARYRPSTDSRRAL